MFTHRSLIILPNCDALKKVPTKEPKCWQTKSKEDNELEKTEIPFSVIIYIHTVVTNLPTLYYFIKL